MGLFESFLEGLPKILGDVREKPDVERKIIYAGTLDEMKNKYGGLIKKRQNELRECVEEGYIDIYILGHPFVREFAVSDDKEAIIGLEDNEGVDVKAFPYLHSGKTFSDSIDLLKKMFGGYENGSKKFTIENLNHILYN